jgi:hypothetical protein
MSSNRSIPSDTIEQLSRAASCRSTISSTDREQAVQGRYLPTFVMIGSSGDLIGFYAVNAHAIDYAELPERFARNRPSHGRIPAAYLAMIGIDYRSQGRGYGGDLLVDGLTRLAHAADALSIAVVLLDILDCGDSDKVAKRRTLYAGYGFAPLVSNPLRLFLPMATVRQLLVERDAGANE